MARRSARLASASNVSKHQADLPQVLPFYTALSLMLYNEVELGSRHEADIPLVIEGYCLTGTPLRICNGAR